MKTRRIYIMFLLTGSLLKASAQAPSPERLLDEVQKNNRTLLTAWESSRAAILEAGTGNTPPDPEVAFGYLFGEPTALGNKVNLNVIQQFDFPSAYIQRSRLKKIHITKAEVEYLSSRQEILLRAKKLWIERIHLNQMETLLKKRLSEAEMIHDHFRSKMEAGEVDRLTFNQSALQLAVLQDEYQKISLEISASEQSIIEMTGGTKVEIKDTLLPAPARIIPDTLFNKYLHSPETLLHQYETELKQQQKNLVVSQNLPRLSAGYTSELFFDKEFKGVQFGMALPLWENANRVKQAKAEVAAAVSDADRFALLQKQELLQKLDQLESLKSRTGILEEALSSGESMQLLTSELESGEISLSEYFYASDFYFRNEQQLLEYRKEQLLIEAELLKVYL